MYYFIYLFILFSISPIYYVYSVPYNVFEGDLVLGSEELEEIEISHRSQRSAIIGDRARWPNAVIPYIITREFSGPQINLIRGAMKEIEDKSCVRFKERSNEADWVRVRAGVGCNSHVGRVGGVQDLNLQKSHCLNHGTIIHEFLHAVGFYHEHSRSDRDNYISIIWPNIAQNNRFDFETKRSLNLVPYDFDSILHYGPYEFSTSGKPSIIPKTKGAIIGQRNHLSQLDIIKINRMYCTRSNNVGARAHQSAPAPLIRRGNFRG